MRQKSLLRIMVNSAGALILAVAGPSVLNAQDITYPDDQESVSLAKSVDKAIQACGVHAAAFHHTQGQALVQRGFDLSDEAPSPIKALSSPSTLGASRYHRWLDPHAEIWLIASKEAPVCHIAISNSRWVGEIGSKLTELVQVGNYWRPAKEGDSPISQTEDGPIQQAYVMDVLAPATVRSLLTITTPRSGGLLSEGQQMIITVLIMLKG